MSIILCVFFFTFVALIFYLSDNPRERRELPPAHYTVEIKSYKQLFMSAAKLERFESDLFEAGGHKWSLVFYPNGNKKDGGNGHISLYLKIDESSGFPDNWSVYANYKMFVQDQKQNNFLTVPDATVRRFDKNKTEWGFGKFLSVQTFYHPSNGFLINDSCVFGAEVSVMKNSGKGESISALKYPSEGTHTWEIKEFSKLDGPVQRSGEYIVGDRKWKLKLYSKGTAAGKGEFLSIYLALVDFKGLPPKRAVYAQFRLQLINQLSHLDNFEQDYSQWFSTQRKSWGDAKFIPLKSLREVYNGYLVDDTLIIKLQFLAISDVMLH